MRHFDLDAIHPLEPMIDELAQAVPAMMRTVTGADAKIEHQSRTPEPVRHGRQTILRRNLIWSTQRGGSSLKVDVQIDRYLNPSEASVNTTLRLAVEPISRLAVLSRVLLGGLLLLIGLVGGLLLWRFLQFDTGMTAPPWAVTGLILGVIVAAAALPVWTHRLGALFEGREAINSPSRRRSLGETLEQKIESLAAAHTANPKTVAGRELPAEPPALAKYTHSLLADPDATIAAYGLHDSARRKTIAAAFAKCFNDADLYTIYQKTFADLSSERQTGS